MLDSPVKLDEAAVLSEGDLLTVTTGVVERTWRWTGAGLTTMSLRHLPTRREWCAPQTGADADWLLIDGAQPEARLLSERTNESDDEGFTSKHLEVVTEIEYPAIGLRLQHVVWVYAGAPGIRAQLRVQAMDGYDASAVGIGASRVEHVPVAFGSAARRAIGYYNCTQQRNTPETEILREELVGSPLSATEAYDWASLLCVEDADGGLCLVKESHKCVNQQGHETGAFHCDESGLWSSGWGIRPEEIVPGRFRSCWANWCVLWSGGDDERELALKQFDRARYPVDAERDLYLMSNTWGSTDGGRDAQARANEQNVLTEIDSAADLGIDMHQIDDGWEGDERKQWRPVPERFPTGWGAVRQAAADKGIRLGLWAAGQAVSLDDLKHNFDEGGFGHYKLDFIHLRDHDQIEALVDKVRAFIKYTGHAVRVNWDVTENPARVGYYWAREYGNIYLENRKPRKPENVVYIPHLLLRDAWQVAKYTNLNKFQVSVQNLDRTDPKLSDACLHTHPYAVAITLMGSPIFFQETQYYDDAARAQIRPLLALYKEHREALFGGYVFPIGDKPDNASWPGFQCHDPETGSGYLLVFRERLSEEESHSLALRFLRDCHVTLTDLQAETQHTVRVEHDGVVDFTLDEAPGFLFCRYEPYGGDP